MRETLLNALIHRDYSYSDSIIVTVILPGLSADDIRNGISQPLNRKLTEIFRRLRLITKEADRHWDPVC